MGTLLANPAARDASNGATQTCYKDQKKAAMSEPLVSAAGLL